MSETVGGTSRDATVLACRIRCQGAEGCSPRDFSLEELLGLVDASADWIWETDADLRFSWLSSSYQSVTGADPRAVIGRLQLGSGTHPPEKDSAFDDLKERRRFRELVQETPNATAPARLAGLPRYSADGVFLGYRGTGRKASEFRSQMLRPAGEEPEPTPAAAARPDITAADLLMARIGADIRTPMSRLLGMAALLARSDLDPRQRIFTEAIVSAGNALLATVDDLLDISRMDAGQLVLEASPFSLAETIESAVAAHAVRAGTKGLELIVGMRPELNDSYVGDAARVRQIVANLIGNAVMLAGSGHIVIEVGGQPRSEGTRVRITVRATGANIPADRLARVLDPVGEPGAASRRRRDDTGLGLVVASRLAALMGGDIGAGSSEGEGATFWFDVVLPHSAPGRAGHPVPADIAGARILIVDDDPQSRATLAERMQGWNFDWCATDNSPEGLAVLLAAAEAGIPVDCIVTADRMPGTNGTELARIVRDTEPVTDTPIVMLAPVAAPIRNELDPHVAIDARLMEPAPSSLLLETLAGAIRKHRAPKVKEGNAPTRVSARSRVTEVPVRERDPLPPSAPAVADAYGVDILVVEDDEVSRLVFSRVLGETPFSFEIVENGSQALEAFTRANPRMILMKVSMPGMDGLEVTGEIRRLEGDGRHVPIIGITAQALKGEQERCLEAGMDDYLPQPVGPRALLRKVERWIRRQDLAAG